MGTWRRRTVRATELYKHKSITTGCIQQDFYVNQPLKWSISRKQQIISCVLAPLKAYQVQCETNDCASLNHERKLWSQQAC